MTARLALLLLTLLAAGQALPAATIPAGFAEAQVATGLDPTTIAFAPDGRAFVCEKMGKVRIIKNGALLATAFATVQTACDNSNERGLMSLCFDPAFASNQYVYIFYTCTTGGGHNRVSRFTASGDVASGGEMVIVDLDNTSNGYHNGGGMRFGKDGKLYIAVGDDGGFAANAQRTTTRLGKLLRINADGTIPSDNPYYGTYNDDYRAIVALGLRNPFTLAVQPGTGLLYLNDVGQSYEEINRYDTGSAPVKRNFGWSDINGPVGSGTPPADYLDPVSTYQTGGEGNAICGGDFYNPATATFPAMYVGKYFFCDYAGGWIKYIDPTSPSTRNAFATGIIRPIDVETAPDGSLWYVRRGPVVNGNGGSAEDNSSVGTGGEIWKITATGAGTIPAKLAFSVGPSTVNAGVVMSPAVKVLVQDAGGVTVTSATNAVTLTLNPGAGTLGGTLTQSAVAGVATFANLTVATAATGYTLGAAASGLTSATSGTFNVLNVAATPVISPGTGSFSGAVTVQLATATPGAEIRYTTNGSAPVAGSALYSAPFTIATVGVTTVKAIALKSGLATSAAASATLTITGTTPYGMTHRPAVTGAAMPATVGGSLPATLTATGLFADVGTLVAAGGIVAYDVNSPLWSDGALKKRWVALPGSSKAVFAPSGEYTWPGGTIFIKHFDLNTDETTPAQRHRLETRVLVLDAAGTNGYGVTYKWNAGGTEATLEGSAGEDEPLTITTASGTRSQTWHYPSRAECLQCHTTTAGFVLGPKTRQLNGAMTYPSGTSDNQLRTWSYLQMFTTQVNEAAIAGYAKLVRVDDGAASLELRVRSYLDANCAQCHRPGGTGAYWDGRFDTPLASQGIIGGAVRNDLGISGAKVVVMGDVPRSLLHLRAASSDPATRMPPLARNVVDQAAVAAISAWIGTQPGGGGGGSSSDGGSSGGCGLGGGLATLGMLLLLVLARPLRLRR